MSASCPWSNVSSYLSIRPCPTVEVVRIGCPTAQVSPIASGPEASLHNTAQASGAVSASDTSSPGSIKNMQQVTPGTTLAKKLNHALSMLRNEVVGGGLEVTSWYISSAER